MKKIIISVVVCVIVTALGFVVISCGANKNVAYAQNEQAYLRLHIRANSNSEEDQAVKMKVKEAVVDYLTPIIANCQTLEEAHKTLKSNLSGIKQVADMVLKENGFCYKANPRLCEEFFPTRCYASVVLNEGVYDALIIDLGSGVGNNWWCVVYPPLCFIGAENTTESSIVYKSKLYEIVNKFFN